MIASLIIILHLTGIITLESATTSLYIAGALLIIAEIGVTSFGLLALNGLLALYAGYALQSGHGIILGTPIGWPVFFGIAIVETSIIAAVIFAHLRLRNMKQTTGKQGMIGEQATIIEWSETNGSVNFEGEIWKAKSQSPLELNEGDTAIIQTINKLDLIITAP